MAEYDHEHFMENPLLALDPFFVTTGGVAQPLPGIARQSCLVGRGMLGSVRDQGTSHCCSHIVFPAATAYIFKRDKLAANQNEELPVLAPQHSMDCMPNYRKDKNVHLSRYDEISNFYHTKGVFEEKHYGFTGLKQACRDKTTHKDAKKGERRRMRVTSLVPIDRNDHEKMVRLLRDERTPLCASIRWCPALRDFNGEGLYDPPPPSINPKDDVYHAILLCGEGVLEDGSPYFIIKNSWGEGWGHEGYALVPQSCIRKVCYPTEPFWQYC